MGSMKPPGVAETVAVELGQPVRLKTWSLIVTVFGDAILPRGGSVSAVTLGEIMQAMGIEAGAVRTAISRLAADGWIERDRIGRTSYYRLAASREADFRQASLKIYPGPVSFTGRHGDWVLVAMPAEAGEPEGSDFVIRLTRDWSLVNLDQAEPPSPDAMIYRGSFVQKPEWFQRLLAPEGEWRAMQRLLDVFGKLEVQLDEAGLPSPVDSLALRCLLIHAWRRIALRLQGLPPSLLPEDWPEIECRNLVARLYQRLLERSEIWLDGHASCENGKLPAADYELYERFH